ncbi:MAG TPA: gephyrin-like molybdotransferase Glp, partial [Holophaga sp.]|nr:gephyrin-like molybdotransferase Glp [Holophaga sp.]
LPPFANSAMDGFAVRAADVASASREHPARLKVVADKPAGNTAPCKVLPGTAVRIMTGAELPPGSEAVVPVEHTASTAREVEILRPIASGENLRFAGEDVRAGTRVLARGTLLRSAEIGLLAAIGHMQVSVRPAPRVAVMTTGAELVEAGEHPGPGQIRDANLHALGAQVREAGCPASAFPRVPDRREAVASAVAQALERHDVLLTNGGVSAGDYDYLKEVLERLGAVQVFSQVAQKPGRPFTFWMLEGRPVFGLPGNPVAAMLCLEMYVRPALRQMMGRPFLFRPRVRAALSEDYPKGGKDRRTHWLRVTAHRMAEGWVAAATGPQGSGILSSMSRANAIAEIPEAAADLKAGAVVDLHLTDLPEDH